MKYFKDKETGQIYKKDGHHRTYTYNQRWWQDFSCWHGKSVDLKWLKANCKEITEKEAFLEIL